MTANTIEHPRIVTPDEWLAARRELLTKEKQLTRQRDALSEERRKLPWTRVQKTYLFDGPDGEVTLADLFAGRVGRIQSGGTERLSETCGEKFTDYIEAKRKAGHL